MIGAGPGQGGADLRPLARVDKYSAGQPPEMGTADEPYGRVVDPLAMTRTDAAGPQP
jgi:hypothetical protein